MGKPAARLTDMTAHGGTIVGPGAPTVMVGKMPAATLLDNHVCPMVTGVVPHVGGPMTLGSTGVFIGKKPAGRVGDMKVCVGPPSMTVMGCFTVLIGEAGGGGGGGAGAAAAAGNANIKGPASIEPFPCTEPEPGTETHYCAFKFTDSAGLPLEGIPFTFKGPDNTEREGASGMGGEVHYSGFTKGGSYKVAAKMLKDAKWSKVKAPVGEEMELTITADGFKDGTPGDITIVKKDDAGGEHFLARLHGKVEGKKLKAKWKIDVDGAMDEPVKDKAERKEEYCQFIAYAGGSVAVSGKLEVHTDLEIEMVDEIGQPLEKQKVEVVLSTGEVKKVDLDAKGKLTLLKVPANISQFSMAPAPPQAPPPGTIDPVSYLDASVDLKKGCRDKKGEETLKAPGLIKVIGSYIFDLQQDMNDLGFPINGLPDGDFGGKVETAVKAFQAFAKVVSRRMVDGKPVIVTLTYTGDSTGVVDAATRKEIKLWKVKKYTRNEVKIYVKREIAGVIKEIPVDGPGDLIASDGKKTKDELKRNATLFASGVDGKETIIGPVQNEKFRGVGFGGAIKLYPFLIKPATEPGIPTMTESQKAIWASLGENEGGLDAINTWDGSYLSVGPFQQTMGDGNSAGELGGVLEYIKSKDAALYENHLGQFGLQPISPAKGKIKVCNCSLDGLPLASKTEKEEYRRYIWAYRFESAMNTPSFRKLFLEFGFQRMNIVDEISAIIDSKTIAVKDVFKSDLAKALLLDTHLNRPSYLSPEHPGIWITAIRKIKTHPTTNKVDISILSADDEWGMIKEILALRSQSKMTNPNLRSGYIIMCCKGFEKEETRKGILEKLGYSTLQEFLNTVIPKTPPSDFVLLTEKSAQIYTRNFLGIPT